MMARALLDADGNEVGNTVHLSNCEHAAAWTLPSLVSVRASEFSARDKERLLRNVDVWVWKMGW